MSSATPSSKRINDGAKGAEVWIKDENGNNSSTHLGGWKRRFGMEPVSVGLGTSGRQRAVADVQLAASRRPSSTDPRCLSLKIFCARPVVADRPLPLYLASMKFRISYFAKPSAPDTMPALLAAPTGDFNTVDDARKAAIADADKFGAADSIIIDPIGERWVKGERLARTDSGWERVPEPER